MSSLTRPLTAQLEVTDRCNLRCRHCYHLEFDSKCKSRDLPDAQVMLMAEKIAEAGVFSMVITGGEPLVRKNLTKCLIKYFKDCNMHVSLNTNLLLLDQETLEYVMSCHLDGMLISCPSLNVDTYRFMTGGGNLTRFLQNTELVIANKQHFAINMVVNRHNFHDIRETAKGCADLGVERFAQSAGLRQYHHRAIRSDLGKNGGAAGSSNGSGTLQVMQADNKLLWRVPYYSQGLYTRL